MRRKHGDVANPGSEIQDTLAWTDARLTKEVLGDRREARRLSNETLVLSICVAK